MTTLIVYYFVHLHLHLLLGWSEAANSDSKDDSCYQRGYQKGIYQAATVIGNGLTILISSIFFGYIIWRTCFYVFYHTLCPLLNIERKERNCGIRFGKACDIWSVEDHTLRDRGTRIICCVHIAGYFFAILLFLTLFFDYYKNDRLCVIQGILEQICIWFQMLMFYNYFIWLFIDHVCFTNLDENRLPSRHRFNVQTNPFAEDNAETDEILDQVNLPEDYADADEEIEVNPRGNKFDDDDDEEEGSSEDIDIEEFKLIGKGSSFRMKRHLYHNDTFCISSFLLCSLEILSYGFVFFITSGAVLVPYVLKLFDPPSHSLRPRWCWIVGFENQLYWFYIELFLGLFIIPCCSVVIWFRYCFYNNCTSKKLSNNVQVRVIWIKVIVYSIVFLGWIVSFLHRLFLYRHGGKEDTVFIAILGSLQEFQMGSYTGFMVIAFFVTNLITMYCTRVLDVGICDCCGSLSEWKDGRHEWIGKHKWTNENLVFSKYGCPTITSSLTLIRKEFCNET